MTIARITKAYVRHYSDNRQTTACVEWIDGKGKAGRTEGAAHIMGDKPGGYGWLFTTGTHMAALLARAAHEGIAIVRETW